MMKRNSLTIAAVLIAAFILAAAPGASAGQGKAEHWTTMVTPKPLSDNVNKGLQWLTEHQLKSGGWGQGEESESMGHGMDNLKAVANVADTCIATLALLRSGSTPAKGGYSKNITRAVEYLCSEVEKSDDKGLSVTSVKGTRVQAKLGPYIDTFMAALILSEVKGKMADGKGNDRVAAALRKTLRKIEQNQKSDGTWDNQGWAPTLSQSMAGKALNRASQTGEKVNEQVRQKTETYARGQFDGKTGAFKKDGSAGVDLYSSAANLGAMQDSANTNQMKMKEAEQRLKGTKSESERKEIQGQIARYQQNDKDLRAAQEAVVKRMDDKAFIQGFGSNGGEEFLSYMNIGESLVTKGGKEWTKWDSSMTGNLNNIQNKDGSWTGHHCITGRTFCTAAALLVLMVDRTPVPVAAKMKGK
ncbi:MAG: terpene cyclase/mutase family protein [Candidatus Eremiobacteraeota bacterium]|nr:terpene cyclase/mutase family protein [Candidatus Eremiobacteraeota bacterium]